ncbi:hypothetical protein QYM36_000134, partial [Artemia franciscana]
MDVYKATAVSLYPAYCCNRYYSLEDKPRSDRPRVIQDEDLRTLVKTDLSQTPREMTEELRVSFHAISDGLKRLRKVKKLK